MFISGILFNHTDPSFSGRKEVMEKSDKFSDDLIRIARQRNFDDKKLKEISSIYAGDIVIKKKLVGRGKNDDIAGLYAPDFQYGTVSKQYRLGKKVLYLRPISRKTMPKSEYIRTFVHEMTHVFQSMDDEISDVALMNKYLKFNSEDESCEEILTASSVWKYFEEVILYPIADGIDSYIHKNGGIFPFKMIIDENKMRKCINDVFKLAQKSFPNANMEFIKRNVKLQLLHEADAYKAGQSALRKYKKEEPKEEDALIPKLYEDIANCMSL